MDFKVEVKGLTGVYETLKALPFELVHKKGGIVKLALKRAAMFLRDQEKSRLRAMQNQRGRNDVTGLLEQNIIASRGKMSGAAQKQERYLVRVKRKIYPNVKGKPVSTIKVAQIFEYGAPNNEQPPRPYIRNTIAADSQRAVSVFTDYLTKRIDREVRKIAKQNEGRK
jgi:hypothetical protein